MTGRCVRLLLVLSLAFTSLSPAAFAQGSSKRMMPASSDEANLDNPVARDQWNRRGRTAPAGESAAALRFRAYQQKMSMRAQRAAAAAAAAHPDGSVPPPATTWVGLGPAPLASDATGNGSQDYNWVSGRATSVLIDPADTTGNTVLLGGAYGGLWKSINAGSTNTDPSLVTWTPLIDDQPTLAVGAIALQPGNSNLILVGTGETNSSGDSYYGLGILRSTDGGASWNRITSALSGQSFLGIGFSKIAFSTSNPNLVVAATAGDLGFVRGEEDSSQSGRGLYFSADAGATWNRVTLSPNVTIPASVSAVVYNPNQGTTGTFYASIRRHGLYSSTDGRTFTRLPTQPIAGLASANCPVASNSSACQLYRAEFAALPQSAGRNELYTWIVDVQNGTEVDRGIWRTINGGTSWTQISETGITHCGDNAFGTDSGCGVQQGAYNLELAAVQNSTSTDLYAGTINIYKCTLGSGTTCSQGSWLNLTHVYGCDPGPLGAPAHVHPDQHGLSFMIAAGKAVGYFAHDGGISRTLDGFTGLASGSCTGHNQFDSLSETLGSMTEFVSFSVHPTSKDIVLGGTQDNGSPKTATATTSTTWQNALGGDGGFNAINPNNGNEWFGSNPGSIIGICEAGTGCDNNSFFLLAAPSPILGNIDTGAFYTPYILDPQNTGEMLIGTCRIWRGATATGTFITLSLNFDTGSNTACTGGELNQVTWLDAGGPKDANNFSKVIYAVTDGLGPNAGVPVNTEGEVWVTTNAGVSAFSNVTKNVNPNGYAISSVAIDPSDTTGQTAYVGIMGFHASHVFKTINAGTSWTDWSGSGGTSIPDAPVQSLIVDSQSGKIYAGTDAGAFVSSTSAASWTEVGPAPGPGVSGFLPNAPVTALRIFDDKAGTRKLRASTYGRGIWEFTLAAPAPDFQIGISNTPQTVLKNQTVTFNGTLTAIGTYNSPVTLSCGAGAPGTCTFSPSGPITPTNLGVPFTVQMSSGSVVQNYTFNIHGTDGTLTHDFSVTLNVTDFSLGVPNPTTVTAHQGGISNSTQYALSSLGPFSGTITLSCSGLPLGATCSFSPSIVINLNPGNSPFNVTTAVSTTGSVPTGSYPFTISAITPGETAKTQPMTLDVIPPQDFTWTGGGSHTVLAGQQTMGYAFMATPVGGGQFATPVTFACSNLPDSTVTCSFNPAQINVGDPATSVTFTIFTKGPNQGQGGTLQRRADGRFPWLPLTLPIAGIVMTGFVGRKVSHHSTMAGLCISLVLLGLLAACGGGNSGPPPPPAVSVSPNPANVSLGGTQQFLSNTAGVTWALSGAGVVGTIDQNTGLYTAPTTGTTPATFTVTATAAGGRSGSGTVNLQPVGVSVNPNTTVNLWPTVAGWPTQTQQFTAVVSHAADQTVNWAVTGGDGNGTIDPNTGLYTAPPLPVPNPATVTVTATSQADASKSGSGTVSILTPTVLGTFPNITVTATEGVNSHSQTVSLTVQ